MSIDLHTLSGAYAIDALSPEEAAQFRKHLDGCQACRDEVRELQEVAALLGASEALEPPENLKAKVMLAADRLPQLPPTVNQRGGARWSPRWTPRIFAAAAAVVMILAAGIGYNQMQQDRDNTMVAPVAKVFNAPDAHTATVDTTNGGVISVATSPSLNEMAVDTDGLPALEGGQVYQLWAVADGQATSAGLLSDPDKGAAMEMPGEGIEVAITIEPAGGSEQPTRDPIISVVPSEV